MNRYSGGPAVLHVATFVAPVVGLALVTSIYDPMPYAPNLFEFMLLWALGLGLGYLMIIVHELGHVVAGLLVGIEVSAINIGHWRRLAAFRLGEVAVTVRAAPSSGYVAQKANAQSGALVPTAVFLLGGVAAEALLMGLVASFDFPEAVDSFGDLCLVFVRVYVLALGVLHIVNNLWPADGWVGGATHATDGLQLLHLWRGRREVPHRRQFLDEMLAVDELCRKKDFEKALEVAVRARALDSDNFHVRKVISYLEMECGRTERAEELWRELLRGSIPSPSVRAELLDFLACLAIYRGRRDLLPEAEAWCNQAIQAVPQAITLKGTLGSVLIELGRASEGVSLLEEVLKKTECSVDRVIAAAYFAKVRVAEGKFTEARQWLEKARALDAGNVVLRRIESQLRL